MFLNAWGAYTKGLIVWLCEIVGNGEADLNDEVWKSDSGSYAVGTAADLDDVDEEYVSIGQIGEIINE